jgi:hypothetical protein
MVDEGVSPLRCSPLLIEDSTVHGSGLLHSGEEVLARDGSFTLGRLQAFEQVHLQSAVAQSVLSDERLEGLAGSESHLVASFFESHTKGDEGLDVAAATDGKDRDVHRRRLTLVDGGFLS